MTVRQLGGIAALSLVLACSPGEAPRMPSDTAAPDTTAAAPVSFVNRVWVVAESPQVAVGDLRVFLADGTMVMASAHGTPAFGSWSDEGGQFTLVEEGLRYPADILELTPSVFRIRIRGPGEPILIRFAPADQSPVNVNLAPSSEGSTR